jgi:outer membrane protein OmpA-like peptidoglycan-associated protein
MKKILLFFLIIASSLTAQNKTQKWQFNAGWSMHKFLDQSLEIMPNLTQIDKFNTGFPLNHFSISRHLFAGFSPELKFSTNMVAADPKTQISKMLLGNGMFNLKYSFANGYVFSENSFFEPYFKGGAGMTYLDAQDNDKFLTTYNFGGGLAFWLNSKKTFGIQLQQLYHTLPMLNYSKDYFEYSASLGYRFGMKDKDKDGIPDDKDVCPDNPGPKKFDGCPDKDGDGIPDTKDRCPEDAGLEEFEGCPDGDGDKVPDIDDKCPDLAGLITFKGCPDFDNDNIPDYQDSCPKIKGIKKFQGCPDKDNDGVPDKIDKCPEVFGIVKFQGCPDRDNDSVPDYMDDCPDTPGMVKFKGCPDPNEVQKKSIDYTISFKAQSIFFQTAKFNILPASYKILDDIAEIIKVNPELVFLIEGHTDTRGGELYNLELSKNRASAVAEYLVSKGVGRGLIESTGFGMKYPIADNRTDSGRSKNRRVDITVKR